MERFHNLSTRLSPEPRRAHGFHRDDAKVHHGGENERLARSSSDRVPAWDAVQGGGAGAGAGAGYAAAHGKETMMFPGTTDAAPDNQFKDGQFTDGIWIGFIDVRYARVNTPKQKKKGVGGGGGGFIRSKNSGGGGGGGSGGEGGVRPRERGLDQGAGAGGGIGNSGARLSSPTPIMVHVRERVKSNQC
jgi:hypothetical protein